MRHNGTKIKWKIDRKGWNNTYNGKMRSFEQYYGYRLDRDTIRIDSESTLLGKVVVILLFIPHVLLCGIGNTKEVYRDTVGFINLDTGIDEIHRESPNKDWNKVVTLMNRPDLLEL